MWTGGVTVLRLERPGLRLGKKAGFKILRISGQYCIRVASGNECHPL